MGSTSAAAQRGRGNPRNGCHAARVRIGRSTVRRGRIPQLSAEQYAILIGEAHGGTNQVGNTARPIRAKGARNFSKGRNLSEGVHAAHLEIQ